MSTPHGEHRHIGHDDWDARYATDGPVWSGNPNGALVDVVSPMPPGRALDVGCGEGADAVWLATRGWQVCALDPSTRALERGRRAAETAGVGGSVTWHCGSLRTAVESGTLTAASFDLVAVCYPALYLADEPMRDLTDLVAPSGALLVLMHADIDRERALAHGFDPEVLVGPEDVRSGLPHGWVLERDEQRGRNVTEGAGSEHHTDVVLLARRHDRADQ